MANVIQLTDNYVATSSVYDTNQNKTQADINSSVSSSITTINSNFSALSGKVNNMNCTSRSTAASGSTSYSGFYVNQVYNTGYPETYGNVIRLGGAGQCELFIAWSGSSGATAGMYFRNRRDVAGATWSKWQKVSATTV